MEAFEQAVNEIDWKRNELFAGALMLGGDPRAIIADPVRLFDFVISSIRKRAREIQTETRT